MGLKYLLVSKIDIKLHIYINNNTCKKYIKVGGKEELKFTD